MERGGYMRMLLPIQEKELGADLCCVPLQMLQLLLFESIPTAGQETPGEKRVDDTRLLGAVLFRRQAEESFTGFPSGMKEDAGCSTTWPVDAAWLESNQCARLLHESYSPKPWKCKR